MYWSLASCLVGELLEGERAVHFRTGVVTTRLSAADLDNGGRATLDEFPRIGFLGR